MKRFSQKNFFLNYANLHLIASIFRKISLILNPHFQRNDERLFSVSKHHFSLRDRYSCLDIADKNITLVSASAVHFTGKFFHI